MIVQVPYGVSANLDLTIGDVAVNYDSISLLEIEVGESLHDYACLTVHGLPTRALVDYQGAPVRFLVSSGAGFVHDFIGTVETVVPRSATIDGLVNGSPFQVAEIRCLGPSYRMIGKRSRVWEGYTLQDFVFELAEKYKFSCAVPKKKLIFPRFVQKSQSDWQALVTFAKMHGLRVNIHGTHIHVYDPNKAVNRNRSLHRAYVPLQRAPRQLSPHPGQVTRFQGQFGRDAADGYYKDAVVGVLDSNGNAYDVSTTFVDAIDTKAQIEERFDDTVDSLDEARARLAEAAIDTYDFHAELQTLGMAGVFPGGIVDLQQYGSDADGFWYVKSVKHSINLSSFMTDVVMAKNVARPLSAETTSTYIDPPESVWRNGIWRAKTIKTETYG